MIYTGQIEQLALDLRNAMVGTTQNHLKQRDAEFVVRFLAERLAPSEAVMTQVRRALGEIERSARFDIGQMLDEEGLGRSLVAEAEEIRKALGLDSDR